MLCKHVIMRSSYRAFQSKSYSTYHCNKKLLTCNNLQISMNTIQSNSQICYCRSSSPIILPKTIFQRILRENFTSILILMNIYKHRKSLERTFRNRLPQSLNSSKKQTKSQNTSNWISSSLMRKNLCRRNILKHNHKLKQNCLCSNINQQLQQNKIFKSQQYQKTRTMQKQQNQVKNRVNRVFRTHHQKDTHLSTCCNQSKRLTHSALPIYSSTRASAVGRNV